MVQTVDYITPVVDDPYLFGQIAVANAVSDVYAMGATPSVALNIVGFPYQSFPSEVLESILKGGADKAAEAGVTVVGGHSIQDSSPKYGLCVTGFINPSRIIKKSGAKPGDVLILTKKIGIGAITTALDMQMLELSLENEVVQSMTQLNRDAAEVMLEVEAHACTDVTGFGLLGHLKELLEASHVGAQIDYSKIPIFPEALEFIESGAVSRGTQSNFRYIRDHVQWSERLQKKDRLILCDAQTSGGLLIAIAPNKAEEFIQKIAQRKQNSWIIGQIVSGQTFIKIQ